MLLGCIEAEIFILHKFKSKNAGDIITLEPLGRQILAAIGEDTCATAIILASEMATAATVMSRPWPRL